MADNFNKGDERVKISKKNPSTDQISRGLGQEKDVLGVDIKLIIHGLEIDKKKQDDCLQRQEFG